MQALSTLQFGTYTVAHIMVVASSRRCGRDLLIRLQAVNNVPVPSQPSQKPDAPNPALHFLQVWCNVVQDEQTAPATTGYVKLTL